MTRSDYLLLARAIRKSVERLPLFALAHASDDEEKKDLYEMVAFMTSNIADVLADDNPRFDRIKFYRNCGLEF